MKEREINRIFIKCPCCNEERDGNYIKIMVYDISSLFGFETGTMMVNCKYCSDKEDCKNKAFDRSWILNHFLNRKEENK